MVKYSVYCFESVIYELISKDFEYRNRNYCIIFLVYLQIQSLYWVIPLKFVTPSVKVLNTHWRRECVQKCKLPKKILQEIC